MKESEKRRAMAEEIYEYVILFRRDWGRQPSQQEIDDYMYSWNSE